MNRPTYKKLRKDNYYPVFRYSFAGAYSALDVAVPDVGRFGAGSVYGQLAPSMIDKRWATYPEPAQRHSYKKSQAHPSLTARATPNRYLLNNGINSPGHNGDQNTE
ncbi:hypothetical protein GCM10023189_08410 [Nibrella saemangeumensis]|uniref:Uncharacterized protein n=1 Tax=Nibrella saemangeumensis TaxID=1084526 RepID=A0ABP8ME94_9BACT